MKILFVNHTASRTGAPISCLQLMAGLGPACEPFFLTREEGPLLGILRDRGIRFRVLAEKGVLGLRLIIAVMRIIRTEGIGLVHLNTLTPFCKYAGIAGFLLRVPVLWVVREDPLISRSRRLRFWMKLLSRRVVFVDQDTRAKLLPEDPRAVVVPNGVDLERFRPAESDFLRQKLGLGPDAPLVGYIGSITKRKGLDVLVRAMADVLPRFPQAKLVLIGGEGRDADYAAGVRALVKELGLNGSVVFCGELPDVTGALNSLDLVVLPSLDERCSRTLLETIASGRPVVATRVGGNPEIVQHGVNGMLVDPQEPGQLAAAMNSLLGDPEAREIMGRNGRSIAEERFGIRTAVAGMQELYTELGVRCAD